MTERDKGSRIHRTAALPRLAEQGTGLHTVCAELTYNPYLLHTSVKFNGQTPRVNSLIEKYQNLPLRDWVEQIPKIFYDEMNGYGFDLYFSGTKSDFLMVQQAFLKAGISSGEVCVLFRNMLEDVDIKYQEVGALLQWLKEIETENLITHLLWIAAQSCLRSPTCMSSSMGTSWNGRTPRSA